MHRCGKYLVAALLSLVAATSYGAETGNAERGAKIFKRCMSCHSVGQNARNGVGPHLNELFGRPAATVEGFKYSNALIQAGNDGIVWTNDQLHAYLADPKEALPGTRMNFRGIAKEIDRIDLLAYLRTFSANPQDIPESEPTARPKDPDVDSAILAIAGDKEYGEYLSSECTTCHMTDGVDEGIPSITGWPTEIFVIVMHAYKTKARPHPVMQMMAGRLSNEEIAALAAYFAELN